MSIVKEFSAIALDITEPEYRAMPELSYSNLSTYEKLGFNGLDRLFDRKESPSLLLGSVVDCLMTGTKEEFESLYTVKEFIISDSGKEICAQLANKNLPYKSFSEIPEEVVSETAKEVGFWQADKWDKRRYAEVLKTGNVGEYYDTLINSDKTVIDTKMYEEAQNCVKALKESKATKAYFADYDIFSPIKTYYQLKFNAVLDNIGYRNMADLIVINYETKTVYPVDLKTSFHAEWDFQKSFTEWQYMIQARLYWRIIRANMDNDPYFKDFSLEDYRFIVVNKNTLQPLVWEFPLTQVYGTLIDENGKEYRDPFEIGKELRHYLDTRPVVPDNISTTGPNTITCLRIKEDTND